MPLYEYIEPIRKLPRLGPRGRMNLVQAKRQDIQENPPPIPPRYSPPAFFHPSMADRRQPYSGIPKGITEEKAEQAAAAYRDGETTRSICSRLNIGNNALYNVLDELGVARRS